MFFLKTVQKLSTILFFFIIFGTNLYSQTPEEIFLVQLEQFYEKFRDDPPYVNKKHRPESEERKMALAVYSQTLNPFHKLLSVHLEKMIKQNETPHFNKIQKLYMKNHALKIRELINYFKPLILSKKLTFQSGDIICSLPHTIEAYQFSLSIGSCYEHCDFIRIDPNGEPHVLMLTRAMNLRDITLAEFLIGAVSTGISNFGIYRYNKEFDREEMDYVLNLIERKSENIVFDKAFLKDIKIVNPEKYFSKTHFFYCFELIYGVYEYILKSSDFDSGKYLPVREMVLKNLELPETITLNLLLTYADQLEKRHRYIILPQIFTDSPDFSRIAFMGLDKPLSEYVKN